MAEPEGDDGGEEPHAVAGKCAGVVARRVIVFSMIRGQHVGRSRDGEGERLSTGGVVWRA